MPAEEDWSLQRAYAFEVQAFDDTAPERGSLKITTHLRRILAKVLDKSTKKRRTVVTLDVDTSTRTSVVRDAVMDFAFSTAPSQVRTAAERLALKLCKSMDGRSHDALFMLVCRLLGDQADVQLMLFPREDVVQLRKGPNAATESVVRLLENGFSAGRHVRKVTSFRGRNIKTKFLKAEVVDWQTRAGNREAADYWIGTFLEARLFLSSQKGSEWLARGLKSAFDAAPNGDDRDLVFAETVRAGQGRVQRCSLATFAEKLPTSVREAFLSVVDDEETRTLEFDVDKNIVRKFAGRRSLEGTDGVRLSVPNSAMGSSVKVESRPDGTKAVRYQGIVAKERVERDDKRG